jgi:hypothetical protein
VQNAEKDFYNNKVNFTPYQVYDKVWYLDEMRRQGISPKLQPMYIGPCLITKKMNDINSQIQVNGLGNSKVVNHDKLKPYLADSTPKWIEKLLKNKP